MGLGSFRFVVGLDDLKGLVSMILCYHVFCFSASIQGKKKSEVNSVLSYGVHFGLLL